MATIVSVHSFRGGTGKSNTTANLAAVFATQGRRVGVIDTDIQSPGIHVLFGLAGEDVEASLNDDALGLVVAAEASGGSFTTRRATRTTRPPGAEARRGILWPT